MLGTKRVPHCARKNRALTGTALSEEMERAEAVGGEAAAASRFRQDADVARVDGVATPAVGWGPRLLPPMFALRTAAIDRIALRNTWSMPTLQPLS